MGPQEFVVEIAGGTGTRPNTAALVKIFTGRLLRCPPSRSPRDRSGEATTIPWQKSARFAIELGKEAARIGGSGGCRNTSQNRQRQHDRSDDLHVMSPLVDQ